MIFNHQLLFFIFMFVLWCKVRDSFAAAVLQAHELSVPSLQRVSRMGGLYNAYSDQFSQLSIFTGKIPENALIENNQSDIEYHLNKIETKSDLLTSMEIEGQLKLSILTGMVKINAGASYRHHDIVNTEVVRGSLVVTLHTKLTSMDLYDASLQPHFIDSQIKNFQFTHAVVAIQYGLSYRLYFESNVSSKNTTTQANGNLMAQLKKLTGIIKGGLNFTLDYNQKVGVTDSSFSVDVEGDCKAPYGILSSFEAVANFIASANQHNEQRVRNGEGRPLTYYVLPLFELSSIVKNVAPFKMFMYNINEAAVEASIMEISKYESLIHSIRQIKAKILPYKDCLPLEALDAVNEVLYQALHTDVDFKQNITAAIRHDRSQVTQGALKKSLSDLESHMFSTETIQEKIREGLQIYLNMIEHVQDLEINNVHCAFNQFQLSDIPFRFTNKNLVLFIYYERSINENVWAWSNVVVQAINLCSLRLKLMECKVVVCPNNSGVCKGSIGDKPRIRVFEEGMEVKIVLSNHIKSVLSDYFVRNSTEYTKSDIITIRNV